MEYHPDWQTVTIDIDRSVTGSFSGDDADQYSELVDLGCKCDGGVLLLVPASALTSSAINVYIHRTKTATEVPVLFQYRQTSDNAPATWATTAATGDFVIHVPCYGVQYIRFRCTTNQTTTDKTFYCLGIR